MAVDNDLWMKEETDIKYSLDVILLGGEGCLDRVELVNTDKSIDR